MIYLYDSLYVRCCLTVSSLLHSIGVGSIARLSETDRLNSLLLLVFNCCEEILSHFICVTLINSIYFFTLWIEKSSTSLHGGDWGLRRGNYFHQVAGSMRFQ